MIRTAEYVSPMHPDKICDRISDAILDECLRQDPDSRVAVETMGGHGIITITGEVTTRAYFDAREIAQKIAGSQYGVQTNIVLQSKEIAQGVDTGGAGDQGIMIGYACDETPELMPLEYMVARDLCQFIFRKTQGESLGNDGKTQITIEDGKIQTLVASFQNVSREDLGLLTKEFLLIGKYETLDQVRTIFNSAGDWKIGGFEADTGVTGRKLMVDSYGPRVAIGGGAFSGKDSTKVDRSGAYKARQLAIEILKLNNAKEVYVYIAYAIGISEPVAITAIIDGIEMDISQKDYLKECKPENIIKDLKLKEPFFLEKATNGHFGVTAIWEKSNK